MVHPTAPEQHSRPAAIRVIVADQDALVRNALRDGLSEAGIAVVGQAAEAEVAVGLAERCAPDVILLSDTLPPEGWFAAMKALEAVTPRVRIIVLAASQTDGHGLHALAQGAAGYLSRDIDLPSVARAVEGVMAGEAAISRAMAGRLAERIRELSEDLSGMRPVKSSLTPREWEVLDLLKDGTSTSGIARELSISPETVHSHVRHLLRKLHVHSRAEAVELATGVLRPEPSG